mmetsp:Transcript_6210/g.15517  ORF Transcript_6210/g.15517 Transcript_6210/m.15517 type:complete len:305 (-) Transcript_6210:2599-3513(-)
MLEHVFEHGVVPLQHLAHTLGLLRVLLEWPARRDLGLGEVFLEGLVQQRVCVLLVLVEYARLEAPRPGHRLALWALGMHKAGLQRDVLVALERVERIQSGQVRMWQAFAHLDRRQVRVAERTSVDSFDVRRVRGLAVDHEVVVHGARWYHAVALVLVRLVFVYVHFLWLPLVEIGHQVDIRRLSWQRRRVLVKRIGRALSVVPRKAALNPLFADPAVRHRVPRLASSDAWPEDSREHMASAPVPVLRPGLHGGEEAARVKHRVALHMQAHQRVVGAQTLGDRLAVQRAKVVVAEASMQQLHIDL